MGPAVDVPDPFAGQVRVELGRGDTRMAEQLLDDAQVGAALEQVRRERVAQRVRADPVGQTRPAWPRRLTVAQACWRASRRPRSPEEQRTATDGLDVAEREQRGPRAVDPGTSQSSATSPTGTSRSLSPLPMTRTNAPSSERSSRSSRSASLTRSPAAYSSSSSARSRRAARVAGCAPRGGARPRRRQRLGQQPRLARAGRGGRRRRPR